jgi:hypothetical protein
MLKRRYTFWINESEAAGLRVIKEREGVTESEQIRQAIRDWIARKGIRKAAPRRVCARRRA